MTMNPTTFFRPWTVKSEVNDEHATGINPSILCCKDVLKRNLVNRCVAKDYQCQTVSVHLRDTDLKHTSAFHQDIFHPEQCSHVDFHSLRICNSHRQGKKLLITGQAGQGFSQNSMHSKNEPWKWNFVNEFCRDNQMNDDHHPRTNLITSNPLLEFPKWDYNERTSPHQGRSSSKDNLKTLSCPIQQNSSLGNQVTCGSNIQCHFVVNKEKDSKVSKLQKCSSYKRISICFADGAHDPISINLPPRELFPQSSSNFSGIHLLDTFGATMRRNKCVPVRPEPLIPWSTALSRIKSTKRQTSDAQRCGLKVSKRSKACKCAHCSSSFATVTHLRNHMRSHTGERPFICEKCKRAFLRNEELTRHMRIHTGEKPFTCVKCLKKFSRKDHMKKHMGCHFTGTT